MSSKDFERGFIESLRMRMAPDDFCRLLRCLDPDLGYGLESLRCRLAEVTPEQQMQWEQERVELQERIRRQEQESLGSDWCDPFISRLPPPRNPYMDVDDVTDLIKYLYATLSRAIADLQYQLAELTGTGRLDPEANKELQENWCVRYWEFLDENSIAAVRNREDDGAWTVQDNTYSTSLQIMTRLNVEPEETAEAHWQYDEHLPGGGPILEYRRRGVFHIAEPPSAGRNRESPW